jgi:O-antigen/teichoic acid export membrane protein
MSQDQGQGVAHKVVRGGMLLLTGQIVARLTGLVSIAILARLLDPYDYGIVALATVFIGLADTITNIRIGSAILRIPNPDRDHFDTAFTVSIFRGAIITILMFTISGWIAEYYNDSHISDALVVLALVPAISGAANPRLIIFEKSLNFKVILTISVSVTIIGTISTILFAFILRNFWALVLGSIVPQVAYVIISYIVIRYRPRFSIRHLKTFISFGGWLSAANVIEYADNKLPVLLVGAKLGSSNLGIYSMGSRLAQIVSNELLAPLFRVLYPGLASVAHDEERLRQAYYRSQEMVLATIMPVGIGVALCANEIILVVAGPKWIEAATVVEFIAPIMALNTMATPVQALVMVTGDTRSLFLRNLANLILRAPLIVGGLYLFGFIGMLVAFVIAGTVFTLTTLALATRQNGGPLWQPFLNGWRSLVSCAVMAASVLAARLIFPGGETNWTVCLLNLLTLSALGATVYITAHYLLWKSAGRPDGTERMVMDQFTILITQRFAHKRTI